LKEGALDRTMWRNSFGRGFGPVVRQNTEWMMNMIYDMIWYDKIYDKLYTWKQKN
jgi:hypothetical protein